jgi:hypothetical protein
VYPYTVLSARQKGDFANVYKQFVGGVAVVVGGGGLQVAHLAGRCLRRPPLGNQAKVATKYILSTYIMKKWAELVDQTSHF